VKAPRTRPTRRPGGVGKAKEARLERLIELARAARKRAYAPYSRYAVGAAIACRSGAVFTGCNVENSSFGATLCAERNAVAQMIAAGERDPIACAIVTGGPMLGSPCGIRRQVLFEFADDMPIALVVEGGKKRTRAARLDTSLAALLPFGFRLGG
jgi:cytidine deaminase